MTTETNIKSTTDARVISHAVTIGNVRADAQRVTVSVEAGYVADMSALAAAKRIAKNGADAETIATATLMVDDIKSDMRNTAREMLYRATKRDTVSRCERAALLRLATRAI